MKYFLIFLFLIGFLGSFLFVTNAYALWLPLSPEDLIEQSETIFVGTVTAITPVDVEYQSQVARNGTIKESIGPEMITLDEYTVNVEEYLKNPQDSNTVTVLQTTVSGVPGSPAKIGGFEIGDRVLFYLPEEYTTKSSRQYLPESFELPEQCDGKDVLMQKRLYGDKEFTIRQGGIEFDGFKKKEYLNFTVNTDPVQFVYGYDTKTMAGKTVDIDLVISKLDSNGVVHKTVFNQTIKAESKPCEWIAHADWEFVPKEGGSYQVTGIAKNIDEHHPLELIIGSLIDVSAPPKSSMSPLQQFKSGIPINEIQCKKGLEIILKLSNDSPACVTPQTKQKLIQRGWNENYDDKIIMENYKIDCNYPTNPYQEYECFKNAYSNCQIATANPEIYTMEGDPVYTNLTITSDCKILGVADMSTDRFWGTPEIITTKCDAINHDEYTWSVKNCDASNLPEMQFNFEMQLYPKILECEENGNTWNRETLECVVNEENEN